MKISAPSKSFYLEAKDCANIGIIELERRQSVK